MIKFTVNFAIINGNCTVYINPVVEITNTLYDNYLRKSRRSAASNEGAAHTRLGSGAGARKRN